MKFVSAIICYEMILLCLALVGAAFWFTHLMHLVSFAPEISDTGYYLSSFKNAPNITLNWTAFGVVLYTFIGDVEVVTLRLIHAAFLFTAPAIGFWAFARDGMKQTKTSGTSNFKTKMEIIALMLISGMMGLIYFRFGTTEPSYNSLLIPLSFCCLICLTAIIQELQKTDLDTAKIYHVSCFLLGFCFAALALTRATAAVAFGLMAVLPVIVFFIKTNIRRPAIIFKRYAIGLLMFIFGLFALIGLIHLRTITISDLIELHLRGYAYIDLLNSGLEDFWSSTQVRAKTLLLSLAQTSQDYKIQLGLASLLLFGTIHKSSIKLRIVETYHRQIYITVLIVFIISLWFVSTDAIDTSNVIWLISIIAFGFAAFSRQIRAADKLVLWAIIILPLTLSFGTNNSWQTHASLYTSLTLLSLPLIAYHLGRWHRILTIFTTSLAILASTSALVQMYDKPYRMNGPLIGDYRTIIGENEFIVAKGLEQTYKDISHVKQTQQYQSVKQSPSVTAPILFDLSGRFPLLPLLLDFNVAGNSWSLSGYDGSEQAARFAWSFLTQAELQSAWVLTSPSYKKSLSVSSINHSLERVDKRFPDDYEFVSTINIGYIKAEGRLYKPKYQPQK